MVQTRIMKGSSHGSSSLTFPRGREMASRLGSQFLASSEPKREWDPGLILRVSPKLLDLSSTAIQTSVTNELDEPGAKRGTRREREGAEHEYALPRSRPRRPRRHFALHRHSFCLSYVILQFSCSAFVKFVGNAVGLWALLAW